MHLDPCIQQRPVGPRVHAGQAIHTAPNQGDTSQSGLHLQRVAAQAFEQFLAEGASILKGLLTDGQLELATAIFPVYLCQHVHADAGLGQACENF
jgi:hypothetical protein